MKIVSIDSDLDDIRKLIVQGNMLIKQYKLCNAQNYLGLRRSMSEMVLPLFSSIDNWLERVTSYIVPIFPGSLLESDFDGIRKLSGGFNSKNIMTEGYMPVMNSVVNSLQKTLDFFDWLIGFDENNLSSKKKANIHYDILYAYLDYIEKTLIPNLYGLEDGKSVKTAILNLYGRMHSLIYSVLKLNSPQSYQVLVSILRGLLEINVDMVLLRGGCVDN